MVINTMLKYTAQKIMIFDKDLVTSLGLMLASPIVKCNSFSTDNKSDVFPEAFPPTMRTKPDDFREKEIFRRIIVSFERTAVTFFNIIPVLLFLLLSFLLLLFLLLLSLLLLLFMLS